MNLIVGIILILLTSQANAVTLQTEDATLNIPNSVVVLANAEPQLLPGQVYVYPISCPDGNCPLPPVPQVPLPGAAWLFGSALAGLFLMRRRKRDHNVIRS